MDPFISIGLPVYNEEKYIKDTLDSLIGQSYQNFEIIISDNASTDNTQRICEQYLLRDNRIRYYRNEKNIGSVNNFNLVFNIASGEYFMWVSGHDNRDADFLSECVSTLIKNPNAVLCYSDAFWIDSDGKVLEKIQIDIDSRGKENEDRFKKVLFGLNYAYPIYGLFRSNALKHSQLLKQIIGADVLLLCELALHGEFIRIPKSRFFIRKLEDYGSWTDYLTKLYGHQISKLQSIIEYLTVIGEFFYLINKYFEVRKIRIVLKIGVSYFFIIKHRGIIFDLLFGAS